MPLDHGGCQTGVCTAEQKGILDLFGGGRQRHIGSKVKKQMHRRAI